MAENKGLDEAIPDQAVAAMSTDQFDPRLMENAPEDPGVTDQEEITMWRNETARLQLENARLKENLGFCRDAIRQIMMGWSNAKNCADIADKELKRK